jgi:hypothetical protein
MAIEFSEAYQKAELLLQEQPISQETIKEVLDLRDQIPENELEFFEQLLDHLPILENL